MLRAGHSPNATALIVACGPTDLEALGLTHLHRNGFNAKPGEVFVVSDPALDRIVVGVGADPDGLSPADWRDVIGTAIRQARQHSVVNCQGLPDPAQHPTSALACATAIAVAAHQLTPASLNDVGLSPEPTNEWTNISREATARADAVNLARTLVDSAPSELTPARFIQICRERFSDRSTVAIATIEGDQIANDGLVGLAAVGAASSHSPALLELRYTPNDPDTDKHVALIGKGVTYDAGGLSLKDATQLIDMKADMAGAAAVAGAIDAVSRTNAQLPVHAYIPLAENAIGPDAFKPGDIITYPNSVAVEITNTDAEGRLILADALLRAQAARPAWIIDIATLTYGCVAALGHNVGGLFSDNTELSATLSAASHTSGDRLWPLPLDSLYERKNASNIADIVNLPAYPYARATTAGLFLRRFVGNDVPWAHIDMYGPSLATDEQGEFLPGATGYGTRLLIDAVHTL